MSSHLRTAALWSAVVCLCTGCGDLPVTPGDLEATQLQDTSTVDFNQMSDRELLIAVLRRLDAMEDRVEQVALAFNDRMDSALTSGEILVNMTSGPDRSDSVSNGRGISFETLEARSDTLVRLASWLVASDQQANKGRDLCVDGNLGSQGELNVAAKAKASGDGSFGVDAYGNGVEVDFSFDAAGRGDVDLRGGLEFKGSWCYHFRNVRYPDPPIRPADQPVVEDLLETTLTNLADQMGLNAQSVDMGLSAIASLAQSPTIDGLRQLPQSLPLPPSFRSITTNPMDDLKGQIPTFVGQALSNICDRSIDFGGPAGVTGLVDEACDRIESNNLPDIELISSIGELRDDFSNLSTLFFKACSRINRMTDISITVEDVTSPGLFNDGKFTTELFPLLQKKLACS